MTRAGNRALPFTTTRVYSNHGILHRLTAPTVTSPFEVVLYKVLLLVVGSASYYTHLRRVVTPQVL